MSHSELPRDLSRPRGRVLVSEHRVLTDEEEAGDSDELGHDVDGKAVAEMLLHRIAVQIREGQDSQRRLVGRRACNGRRANGAGGRARRRPRLHLDLVDVNRLLDVLEPLLSKVRDRKLEPTADLLVHDVGHADGAWSGEALEPGCDVDPVSVDPRPFDHQVTQVDPDAKQHAPIVGKLFVLRRQRALDLESAAHRADGTGELGEQVVARGVDYSATEGLDEALDLTAMSPKRAHRGLVVFAHQSAVTDRIGAENGGQPAIQRIRGHLLWLPLELSSEL